MDEKNMSVIKKDVMIKIVGTQEVDGDIETVEIETVGQYFLRNKSYYIVYDETESTGYADCRTTVKLNKDNIVSMTRKGASRTNIIIENGVRHHCKYGTLYGDTIIGIMGHKLESKLNVDGGSLEFEYSIDVNTNLASENKVKINIKEC